MPAADSARAFLGLGSNLGDREANLRHAVRRLGAEMTLAGVSSVYETDPVGFLEQPRFLNVVVEARTDRDPGALLELARSIELELGRERTFRNAPRTLDIDILLYDDRIVRSEGLTVPHARMRGRPFVLVPLLELDPGLREPATGEAYASYLEQPAQGVRWAFSGQRLLEAV